ncbi:uncharacterized protein LOC130711261 isoform X3 [Lotus japonicus]|uniref:uncharacterized protein LOC130711261 isoform X3 n=1 Tax=Lotus japonicus TaxID=34305 RepID=UPI00258E15E9|nr:uncharacterized protein LOC130711261 isoform X3 [Lotus japonicus]
MGSQGQIYQSTGHLATKTHGNFSKMHMAAGGSNYGQRMHKKSLLSRIKDGFSGHSSDDNSDCSDSGSDSDHENFSRRKNYCD